MERFREQLAGHTVIGLDTSIFIYHLEAHPRYQALTQELLIGVQAGQQEAVTSVVTVMELTVRPWRVGRAAVAREYETLLVHFPNLTLADVTRLRASRNAFASATSASSSGETNTASWSDRPRASTNRVVSAT